MNKLAVSILTLLISFNIYAQSEVKIDWFHLDKSEGYNGVASKKAYLNLIKNQGSPVVVAVIDSGVDVDHNDLKDNIWTNPREIPNNGIDDDKNGYIDDIHGWNFIGGPNGKNVGADSYEGTRLYGKLKYKYENADPSKLNKTQKEEYALFLKVKKEVEDNVAPLKEQLANMDEVRERVYSALAKVDEELKAQNLSVADISKMNTKDDTQLAYGKRVSMNVLRGKSNLTNMNEVKEFASFQLDQQRKDIQNKVEVGYNPDFDPRTTIVMDNYADSYDKLYGNNDYEGPDAMHGTHVAGIIGAVRGNNIGMDGVASNVKIMSVRAVPDGDERDKDVANAIRYAVDNGASIINMSFGKAYSWDKKAVDDAVKYAEEKDVLLVHAAGNSAQDNDVTDNFPNDYLGKKGFLFFKKDRFAKNWIEVGALDPQKDEKMVATFSNYGTKNVDIFAPGVRIYSTLPNNQYQFLAGTSMASPVVAGVAAVVRSQYPSLTAEQVKDILLKSSNKFTNEVKVPGSDKKVGFNKLSTSGGTVDLYNALEMAATVKGKKK